MTRFLIDSGALLAMLDARDKYHTDADAFIKAHVDAIFYMPDTIFAETMTLVKARLGTEAAIKLGESIRQSTQFIIVPLADADREATWEIFSGYKDKAWSYADCSILATARRLQINTVFSFDHHIDQMAEVMRRP